MSARCSILDTADVKYRAIEIDLIPPQVADLSRLEPVTEGEQDHGRVPMAIAIGLGGFGQSIDLAGRQVFWRAKLNVRSPCRRNCS
jgi:hypothetical protein